MRKTILALAAAGLAIPAAPAMADPPRWAPAYGQRDPDNDRGRDYRNDDRRARYYQADERRSRNYDDRGRYSEPRRINRDDRVWRGDDGRYYCERENGTTGLIIGAAGGALLGREVDGGRNRTLGTVLGAALGGLVGRGIDLSDAKCR